MNSQDRPEVHLLGFGEPDSASPGETVDYLERIFRANASLDGDLTEAEVAARCRELAERRAPGLLADYEMIGGSPLLEQCRGQAVGLADALRERGLGVPVRIGMQFTAPYIEDVARLALEAGATRIVALPLYPLCGASTTVAALDSLRASLEAAGADSGRPIPSMASITGWHMHSGFVGVVSDGVAAAVEAVGASLDDPETELYFSAHGTPLKYLRDGSRYDRYVEQLCAGVAERLGVDDYALGFQNHANRGIEWTAPSNEELIPTLDARRLVVVPISFIHEQSETLVELDEDLCEFAAGHGKEVVRVPVPFDAPGLIGVLADLVYPVLRDTAGSPAGVAGDRQLRPCRCRPEPGTWCLSGD